MHLVLEGLASKVVDAALLQSVADAYRSKYDWNVTVADGAFDAPYGAPTAGPPPYQPYEIRPAAVFGFRQRQCARPEQYPLAFLSARHRHPARTRGLTPGSWDDTGPHGRGV